VSAFLTARSYTGTHQGTGLRGAFGGAPRSSDRQRRVAARPAWRVYPAEQATFCRGDGVPSCFRMQSAATASAVELSELPAARMDAFLRGLPKTDLHMHLEGSLEPELLFELAARNHRQPRWASAADLREAYRFSNLQSFLELYYEGCEVLVTERDFYDLTQAYLRRAAADRVVRAEVFVGPQSFTTRGTPIAVVMDGVLAALDEANQAHTISAGLIVSAQRHRTQAEAFELLEQIRPWADRILGIGLGGAERGNPPSKFAEFFRTCKESGFHTTIHAGEEGPAEYVRQAVETLGVDRIDHGIACLEDPDLVRVLADLHVPLTVCPVSNLRLKVVPSLQAHPLKRLLESGLHATVNSDDPAYFGAYASDNLIACQHALGLTVHDILRLVRNGFSAAFMAEDERQAAIARLEAFASTFDPPS
jgi:adenine deaminase